MIQRILYKYLANEASEKEVETLFEWIAASEENKKHFIRVKKTWAITALSHEISGDLDLENPRPAAKISNYLKYAALILLLLGLGKVAADFMKTKSTTSKEIVLELEDGTSEIITKKGTITIANNNGDLILEKFPNEIRYVGTASVDKTKFHTLKVPYGKTFKIIMSDGTAVQLNSGTTLRYPEQFATSGNRTVYLTGEAFFKVKPNKKQPFVVQTEQVAIAVLGTQFNVSAYPENSTVNSTLIEGSVQMYETANQTNGILLVPNQMATWHAKSKKIVRKEVDPLLYMAWTKGELAFKDTPFSTIAKMLQRTYDVQIINKNDNLAKQHFTGTITISDATITSILELLKRDTPFHYTLNQNTVTITTIP